MHKEPSKNPQKHHPDHTAQHSTPYPHDQHGLAYPQLQTFSVLLALPSESLTHVTSFLDPHSLLALSRTNKQLYEHIKDDNTWHRAFVFQFLGIVPESNVNGIESLMLRRTESTWRKEYVFRWNLRRRWERSRSPTIAHIPHHSPISNMHLMSENALLTSSLLYGIVSRSVPLTGKILKGFLDAAGSQHGLGIGNPNAEFTPNVSACALASEGAVAKVLWGFRSGEVALITATRAMDTAARPAARLTRCTVQDQHEAEVMEVAWDEGHSVCVSGDREGAVKLWDAMSMRCLWSSEKKQGVVVPSPCVKVAVDAIHGIVVAGMSDGDVIVWSGFGNMLDQPTVTAIQETRIPSPADNSNPFALPERRSATAIFIDAHSPSQVWVLAVHENDPRIYRLEVNTAQNTFIRTSFGDESSVAVRSVLPSFTTRPGESNFVIVGDQLGHVSIYDWHAGTRSTDSIFPTKRFEAHDDGAVTALAANATVVITGSERGTTKVWDSLTLSGLRTNAAPSTGRSAAFERVEHIVLTKDMMVATIGTKVLAWKAGPVSNHPNKTMVKSGHKKWKRAGAAKGHLKYEIDRDIKESNRALEYERKHSRAVRGREKEHRNTLEGLGLSEVEAVEYALMLSRDEEEQRRVDALHVSLHSEEEGVFQADFDGIPELPTPIVENTSMAWAASHVPKSPSTLSATRYSPPAVSRSPSTSSLLSEHQHRYTHGFSRSLPRNVPSMSSNKLQVSPRFRAEPMEAGFEGTSPISLGPSAAPPPSSDDHFPPMSRTPSSAGASTPSTPGVGGMRRSMSGSPEWARVVSGGRAAGASNPGTPGTSYSGAAGRAPVVNVGSPRLLRSPGVPAPALMQARSEPATAAMTSSGILEMGPSLLSTTLAATGGRRALLPQDEDEELRFAIELSLAEARSRGENI